MPAYYISNNLRDFSEAMIKLLNLQSPAVGKGMAKLFLLILEIKVEADSGLPLQDIKFSLLPDILQEVHIIIFNKSRIKTTSQRNLWKGSKINSAE